jgi:hypothetical protein
MASVTHILHVTDLDSLGDMSGADERASYDRYQEMAEEALREAFPGVEVRVEPSNLSNGGYTEIHYTDAELGVMAARSEGNDPTGTLYRVREITGRLWESGAWMVAPTLTDEKRAEVVDLAHKTAVAFVEEYGEALDPAETDWDGVAWSEDRLELSFRDELSDYDFNKAVAGLYLETLVAETERLASEDAE